jgi:hypothetical protein
MEEMDLTPTPPPTSNEQRAIELWDVYRQLVHPGRGGYLKTKYHTEQEGFIKCVAQALSAAEARGRREEQEVIQAIVISYLGGLAVAHSWLPLHDLLPAIRSRH